MGSSKPIVAFFVVGYLLVQVTVPLVLLIQRGGFLTGDMGAPRHFSWQMYSSRPGVRWVAAFRDGREEPIDPRSYVNAIAARAQYGSHLPRWVCAADPEIAEVKRVTRRREKRFRC
jgi:hypothetical protein